MELAVKFKHEMKQIKVYKKVILIGNLIKGEGGLNDGFKK